MKAYLAAAAVGLLVGIVYALFNVRSPAPPVVALVGLMGILIGEQIVPIARALIAGCGLGEAVAHADCRAHVLGQMPSNVTAAGAPPADRT
jgi:XapX domain-containing protein